MKAAECQKIHIIKISLSIKVGFDGGLKRKEDPLTVPTLFVKR